MAPLTSFIDALYSRFDRHVNEGIPYRLRHHENNAAGQLITQVVRQAEAEVVKITRLARMELREEIGIALPRATVGPQHRTDS